MVREVFIELFCMPRSSLDNPNLRTGTGPRAFCILDQGEMYDEYGYWAEDENSGEVGFLPELEDVFWVFQDTESTWIASRFQGRKMRRGPAKGKGKGKGRKGFNEFKPYVKKKGKGNKGKAHEAEHENTGTPKGPGKKGKKGKYPSSGKGYEAEATPGAPKADAQPEPQGHISDGLWNKFCLTDHAGHI